MSTNTELVCDNCGAQGARIVHLSKSYGEGSSRIVIDNVPVIYCPACGESYLTATTLHEMEGIRRSR